MFWYLQTGSWLLYSYNGESFDFLNPEFYNILFSYKKGLFVYTPILFFGLLSTSYLLFKDRYLFITWWLGFVGITYVLSSWWSWYYGCSYGNRAYIEFYPFFFIPLAIVLSKIGRWNYLVVPIALLTIPLNFIQTYQYKTFTLHWINMDKVKYWNVFLETDPVFYGITWKENLDLKAFKKEGEYFSSENTLGGSLMNIDSLPIPDRSKPFVISISFKNVFNRLDRSKMVIGIKDHSTNDFLFWREIPVIHFQEKGLNNFQLGRYDLNIPAIPGDDPVQFQLQLKNDGVSSELKHLRVDIYQ